MTYIKVDKVVEKNRLHNEEGKVKCNECGVETPINEFNKCKGGMFGVKSKCKICISKSSTYQKQEYKVKNETLLLEGRKICSKCKVEKSVDDYGANVYIKCGINSQCRVCCNSKEKNEKRRNKRKVKNPEYYDFIDEKKILLQQGECRCYQCKEVKPLSDYSKTIYLTYCKDCTNINNKSYNKTKRKIKNPEYYVRKEERETKKIIFKEKKDYDNSLLIEGKKKCYKCEDVLSIDKFETTDKYHCIVCNSKVDKESKKRYNKKRYERHKIRMKTDPEYRARKNKEKSDRKKIRMKTDPVYCKRQNEKDRIKSKKRYHNRSEEQKENDREKDREYEKRRRKTDTSYALKKRISISIRNSLSRRGYSKTSRTHEILGCSFEDFYEHMESLFTEGMNWDNRHLWHIDHKIPLASVSSEEDIIRLNHYSNLQPLWGDENIRKGDKLDWEYEN